MIQLPRYKSHKEVSAAKIDSIKYDPDKPDVAMFILAVITDHGGLVIWEVAKDWVAKHGAEVGGYLVVYGDGYQSYSPAKAFEEGYSLVTEDELKALGGDKTEIDMEREIQALNLEAPRITPEQISLLMARVTYRNEQPKGTTSTFVHAFLDDQFYLASGHTACVSLENFNAALGIKYAKISAESKARDKLWELAGYALREQLYQQTQPAVAPE